MALLDFRSKSGDAAILRDFHMQANGTGGKKVIYCPATSQNRLIDGCAEYIRESILVRARKSAFFSILADEATDAANLEQMPLILRFAENYQVR